MDELDKKELETIQAEITDIQETAKKAIKTQEDAEKAGAVAKVIKSAKERITNFFEPRKKRARAVWQDWLDAEKAELKPWEDLDGDIRKNLGEFARVEEQKRREAVEAARAKAEVKAEKQTEKTGVYHAPAPVAEAAKVSTTSAKFRTDWKFEYVDKSLIPRQFLTEDEKTIRAYVSSKKADAVIPGIRVYSVQTPVI